MEYYLAYPLRWLAKWSGLEYNGEFRNGHAAHIGWGGYLTLALGTLVSGMPLLMCLPAFYGVFRELQDSNYSLVNWNKKSWTDLLTWEFGCLIGVLIWLVKYLV